MWAPFDAVSIVLLVLMNAAYVALTCIGPGVVAVGNRDDLIAAVKKRQADAENCNDAQGLMDGHDGHDSLSAPVTDEDEETGRITIAGLRMCHECEILQPIRAKHCGWINRCVHKYDHYCVWIG